MSIKTTKTDAHRQRAMPRPLRTNGLHAITDTFQGCASSGPSPSERFCKACGTTKPTSEFYTGRPNHCKTCYGAQVKANQKLKPFDRFVLPDPPVRNSTMRGDPYTCPELRTHPRQAPSAHSLPSRVGQRLHHPDGRVTDLAGHPLKD